MYSSAPRFKHVASVLCVDSDRSKPNHKMQSLLTSYKSTVFGKRGHSYLLKTLQSRPPAQRSQIRHASVHPQGTNSIPESFLTRQNAYARPLPPLSSLTSSRRWLTTFPIFAAIVTLSALGIFNYQKVNSPVISANLYSLRTNPRVRELLGNEVYFASKWAWIWGELNLVQGRVDVKFDVKGTRQQGLCRFRARRFGGKSGSWKTEEWSLTVPDGQEKGRVIDLLTDEGGTTAADPMEGATY